MLKEDILTKSNLHLKKLVSTLEDKHPLLLKYYPPEKYILYLNEYPKNCTYRYISHKVSKLCNEIQSNYGENVLSDYHQLILLKLVGKAQFNSDLLKLSPVIQHMYWRKIDRIIKSLERKNNNYYIYSNKNFIIILAICKMSMIPLGSQIVSRGEIPRSIFRRSGLLKSILFVRKFGFILAPYYRLHSDFRDRDLIKQFNPEGWFNFYLRLAELLKKNKDIKGVCGTSWFFDPYLEEISPELSYLRETAIKSGAILFRVNTPNYAWKDAIFMNPNREKLYREGKYKPKTFAIIISRDNLINWADSVNLKISN